jgi:hypothetical protein
MGLKMIYSPYQGLYLVKMGLLVLAEGQVVGDAIQAH